MCSILNYFIQFKIKLSLHSLGLFFFSIYFHLYSLFISVHHDERHVSSEEDGGNNQRHQLKALSEELEQGISRISYLLIVE